MGLKNKSDGSASAVSFRNWTYVPEFIYFRWDFFAVVLEMTLNWADSRRKKKLFFWNQNFVNKINLSISTNTITRSKINNFVPRFTKEGIDKTHFSRENKSISLISLSAWLCTLSSPFKGRRIHRWPWVALENQSWKSFFKLWPPKNCRNCRKCKFYQIGKNRQNRQNWHNGKDCQNHPNWQTVKIFLKKPQNWFCYSLLKQLRPETILWTF